MLRPQKYDIVHGGVLIRYEAGENVPQGIILRENKPASRAKFMVQHSKRTAQASKGSQRRRKYKNKYNAKSQSQNQRKNTIR